MDPTGDLELCLAKVRRQVARDPVELGLGERQSAECRPGFPRPVALDGGVRTKEDPLDADLANPSHHPLGVQSFSARTFAYSSSTVRAGLPYM